MAKQFENGPTAYAAFCEEMEKLTREPSPGSISGAAEWTQFMPAVSPTGALTATTANLRSLAGDPRNLYALVGSQPEPQATGAPYELSQPLAINPVNTTTASHRRIGSKQRQIDQKRWERYMVWAVTSSVIGSLMVAGGVVIKMVSD